MTSQSSHPSKAPSGAAAPLFRMEALAAQGDRWLGSIRIGRNPAFTLVASVALLLGGALLAFAAFGQVARKATIPGLLVPALGTLQVSAAVAGVLVERRVVEGEPVRAGQVMFVLATDRATSDGPVAALVAANLQQRRASVRAESAAREQQARQRRQALAERLRALDAEHARAEQEAELAERRAVLARKSVARYEQLVLDGFVADAQAQAKQEELLDLEMRVQAARRGADVLMRERQGVRAELAAAATQWAADSAQLARAAAAVEQEVTENEANRTLMVTAPQGGIVTALHLPLGAAVQAGQALGTLVPGQACAAPAAAEGAARCTTSPLEAHLYAPSRTAGFVQPGQAVWLRYAAFPYQKFGMARGMVTSVSRTPLNPQDLPAGQATALLQAARSQEPLYRIGVRLAAQTIDAYGQAHALRPGMTLEADVVQECRAVWEWLLEPVLATTARVKVPNDGPNSSTPGG